MQNAGLIQLTFTTQWRADKIIFFRLNEVLQLATHKNYGDEKKHQYNNRFSGSFPVSN